MELKNEETKSNEPIEPEKTQEIKNSPSHENNDSKNNQTLQKKEKIKLPKRKYAIIHGYFGQNYSGNQKNPGVRTVEDELEKALYKEKFISDCNYGNLSKIDWMRASRTDKGVSAIMNVISAKLHKYPNISEQDMKEKLNAILPKDIRIFRVIEVSNHFDSKENNNNREYHYVLPTFLLEPRKEENKKLNEEANTENKEDVTVPKDFIGNYSYRLTEEDKKKLNELCKGFLGSKKYHNYTRKIGYSDPSSLRHILEMTCDDIIDFGVFEVIKFKLIGQSFLYNQIRKMIGMIIDCLHNKKDIDYFNNSFLSNKYDIPKAPGEGLYLRNIDYSKYNDRKLNKKNNIFLTEDDEKEMESFRVELVKQIKETEVQKKVFSAWLWKLDNKREWAVN